MDPILGKGIDKIIEGASKGPVETFSKLGNLSLGNSTFMWIKLFIKEK